MPAWITSELRELVWVPIASSASRITTSRPLSARARATARPTTPAPMTTASSLSTHHHSLEGEGGDAGQRRHGGHGPGAAVERGAEGGAHHGAGREADRADQRGRRAGGGREGRERGGGCIRHDQRRAEQEREEGQHHSKP